MLNMRRVWRRTSSSQAEPSPWRHCWTSWASCSKLPQPHLPDTCLGSTRRWVFRPANVWNAKCTGNVPALGPSQPTVWLASYPLPPRLTTSSCYNLLEPRCLSLLDAAPCAPVLCFLMALKSRKALFAALAILVAGYLLYHFRGSLHLNQFSGAKLWEALRGTNPLYILASVILIYFCYLLRAVRWQNFQKHVGSSHTIPIYKMTLAGFAAVFIFSRLGEPVRPLLISRKE